MGRRDWAPSPDPPFGGGRFSPSAQTLTDCKTALGWLSVSVRAPSISPSLQLWEEGDFLETSVVLPKMWNPQKLIHNQLHLVEL